MARRAISSQEPHSAFAPRAKGGALRASSLGCIISSVPGATPDSTGRVLVKTHGRSRRPALALPSRQEGPLIGPEEVATPL